MTRAHVRIARQGFARGLHVLTNANPLADESLHIHMRTCGRIPLLTSATPLAEGSLFTYQN